MSLHNIHYAQSSQSRSLDLIAAIVPPVRAWRLALPLAKALAWLGLYQAAARTVYAAAAYQRRILRSSP